MEKDSLTQKELKKILHYNTKTGDFTWLVDRGANKVKGKIAGNKYNRGYIRIQILPYGKFLAHRLAFLYMEGYFPEYEVDHKNRIRCDNRWCNLREASHQCNVRNSDVGRDNTTSIKGVTKYKNEYRVMIQVNHKYIHLGYGKLEQCASLRWEAEKKYNYPNCNSTSSALEYLKSIDSKYLKRPFIYKKKIKSKTGFIGIRKHSRNSFQVRCKKIQKYAKTLKKAIILRHKLELETKIYDEKHKEKSQVYKWLKENSLLQ